MALLDGTNSLTRIREDAMENLNRLTDAQTLRDTVDRLIQDNVVRPIRGIATSAQGWFPIDMLDQGDELMIRASLPGINPDDLDVHLQGDLLTIHGDHDASTDTGNWLVRERPTGTFNRTLNLPFRVDPDRVDASYEQGVLTLRFPKTGLSPAKHISVRSSRTSQAPGTSTSPGQPPITGSPTPTDFESHPATTHLESGTEPRDPGKDEVTEASIESFPASDPPAWGGSHRV
jgi:HSP20 family protein